MHLVGLNGFRRSGKNTTATILEANYVGGHGVTYQVGFADKVKIAGARALGYVDESPRECIALMDEAKEKWIFNISRNFAPLQEDWMSHTIMADHILALNGRQYLQNIGTEMRKLFGEDFWVDQVLPHTSPALMEPSRTLDHQRKLERLYPGVDCVAITDLRFENEAQRVLDLGGVVWRVNRDGIESDGHASEQRLPDSLVSYEIDNNGDFGDLEYEVERAMETL